MRPAKPLDGAAVRAFRESRGWTQADLAAALGMHANTVARMERDELPVSPRTAAALRLLGA